MMGEWLSMGLSLGGTLHPTVRAAWERQERRSRDERWCSWSSRSAAHHRNRPGRWDGIRRPPRTRAAAPRTKLSSGKIFPEMGGRSREDIAWKRDAVTVPFWT